MVTLVTCWHLALLQVLLTVWQLLLVRVRVGAEIDDKLNWPQIKIDKNRNRSKNWIDQNAKHKSQRTLVGRQDPVSHWASSVWISCFWCCCCSTSLLLLESVAVIWTRVFPIISRLTLYANQSFVDGLIYMWHKFIIRYHAIQSTCSQPFETISLKGWEPLLRFAMLLSGRSRLLVLPPESNSAAATSLGTIVLVMKLFRLGFR